MKNLQIVIAFLVILSLSDIAFAFGPYQGNWRWRNDDGDVYTATWKDSLNTPVVLTENENIRLRIESIFPVDSSVNISLAYTEDFENGPWIPITSIDTGKFFISASQYLLDTMSYFDNQLLPQNFPEYLYRRTITFDETDNYYLFGEDSSIYELEYSIKPTSNIQAGSAYFFGLCINSLSFPIYMGDGSDYPALMTSPFNWISQLSGTTELLSDISIIDENIATAVGSDGTILRTTNGGSTWITQMSGIIGRSLSGVYFTDANNGTAVGGIDNNNNSGILRTTNGGETWGLQFSQNSVGLSDVCFTSPSNGVVVGQDYGGTGIILSTSDGGTNWNEYVTNLQCDLFAVSFVDDLTGWAVGGSGVILKTIDGGNTWFRQLYQYIGTLLDVSFINESTGIVVGSGYDGGGIVYKTTNGGSDWFNVSTDSLPPLRSVHFENENIAWVVGGYNIFKTTNGGLNWIKLVSGSSQWLQSVRFIDSETGWVVGDHGKILKTTNGGVSFVEEEEMEEIPTSYFLSNNYPNPFNPTTKIQYSIPQTSNVVIKVYDILGSEIETLVNEEKPTGSYEITWYAENLPSGVYFYQLKAGEFISTKKMILIK